MYSRCSDCDDGDHVEKKILISNLKAQKCQTSMSQITKIDRDPAEKRVRTHSFMRFQSLSEGSRWCCSRSTRHKIPVRLCVGLNASLGRITA